MRHNDHNSDESGLSARQLKALACLLRDDSPRRAAKSAGVAASTLYRWMANPDFKKALAAQRKAMIQTALDRAVANIEKAVSTLIRLLDCESPAVQRGAAGDLLDLALRVTDIADLENRLSEVEGQLCSGRSNNHDA